MRFSIIIGKLFSAIIVFVIMLLFMLVSLSGPYRPEPEPVYAPPAAPASLEELLPQGMRDDMGISLRVLSDGLVIDMSMERYLIGAVAAEMPAGFPLEALKAQAVAARTMVLYIKYVRANANHPDADVCTDFACCMAFNGDERLHDRWGDDYRENIVRIISAVVGTDGVYMAYNDDPILAVFHSSSAGKTESSGNVWVTDMPYLKSVSSPESSLNVPDFVTTASVSLSEFYEMITESYPDVDFDDFDYEDKESWITDITYSESGRILDLNICGATVRGPWLRQEFGLRSTAIEIEIGSENIVFTVTGFGHGVGMSQYGAAVMATSGMNFREILRSYYTGVELQDISPAGAPESDQANA